MKSIIGISLFLFSLLAQANCSIHINGLTEAYSDQPEQIQHFIEKAQTRGYDLLLNREDI